MSLFIVIALTIIAALHFWFYRRLALAPQGPRRVRIGIAITLGVLGLLLIGAESSAWAPVLSPDGARPLAWVGVIWLAFGLYLALGLLVVAIVAALVAWRGGPQSRPLRLRINRIGAVLSVAVAAATTTWGIVEAETVDETSFDVTAADLPAEFDGTRVVLISDLHIGAVNSDRLTQRAVDMANAADPDIVILAGDLIEGSAQRYGYQLAPLTELQATDGVYAVTGNHEFISGEPEAWMQLWADLGVTVLQNESLSIERGNASITIAGVHDASGDGDLAADPQAALAGVDPDTFILYVAHQPSQAYDAQGFGIDLQVSGHTHGGQLWPMHYVVAASQPMLDGQADVGDVPVITSRGAAQWGPPVRVGAPAEIPVITLHAA